MSEFVEEIREYHGEIAAATAEVVLRELESMGLGVRRQSPVPTKGLGLAVIEPAIHSWNATLLVGHAKSGTIGWELLRLRKHQPFKIPEQEAKLRQMLEPLPGFISRPDYPAVTWNGIAEGSSPFLEAVRWTAERVRGSNPAG